MSLLTPLMTVYVAAARPAEKRSRATWLFVDGYSYVNRNGVISTGRGFLQRGAKRT